MKTLSKLYLKIASHPAVLEVEDDRKKPWNDEGNGWWAYARSGWYFPAMECHTAHEDTLTELWRVVQSAQPCDCVECAKYGISAKTTYEIKKGERGYRHGAP